MSRLRYLLTTLAVAVLVHCAAVLAVPRVVMHIVLQKAGAAGTNRPFHAPRPDAAVRNIPLPSPDLLYSGCVLDVTDGDVDIAVHTAGDYISLSVFDGRSDNLLVASDRSAVSGEIRVLASRSGAAGQDGLSRVVLPGGRGLLLLRALAATPDMAARAEVTRRSLRCDKTASR